MFDSIFVDMKTSFDVYVERLNELIDEAEQEQIKEQQHQEEETNTKYPKTTYYA